MAERKEPFSVRFQKAWEEHWYFYKWQTWIAIVAIFCTILFVGEKLNQKHPDMVLTYIGTSYLDETFSEKINADFKDVAVDVNGDGEILIQVKAIHFTGPSDLGNLATLHKADTDFMSGESVLYLIDAFAYETFALRESFQEMHTSQGAFSYLDLTENTLLNTEQFDFTDVYLCQRKYSYQDTESRETELKYQNAGAVTEKILKYQ